MNALIVDDERLARLELRRLLAAHPEVQIAGEARSGLEALDLIPNLSPDLVFLDIQMPGMTGFELLESLDEVPAAIIFTTAYDQYAIRAFEVNALDYLLKPVAPARLAAALSRVRPRTAARLQQVFVRDGERCWIVRVADIFLLESEGNYTRVCFGDQRPLIRRSLNALEAQLDPAMFFRAGRQQILNLRWIEKVEVAPSGALQIILRGGRAVEMSRRQSTRLREVLSW